MAETSTRRRRALSFLLGAALIGLLLHMFSEPRSAAAELGATVLLACFVAATYFVFFFAKKRARLVPFPLQFDADAPFVPHVVVDLSFSGQEGAGALGPKNECCSIFAIGQQGFTARFIVPAGTARRACVPLRVEAQFLRPELALPCFPIGTGFSVVAGPSIVGSGEVVRVLAASPAQDVHSVSGS